MKKKIFPLIFLIAALSAISFFSWLDKREQDSIVETASAFPTMSTIASFRFYGNQRQADKAVELARKTFERVEKNVSFFDPESELSKLNATAAETPFRCSNELWEILQYAREYHRLSNGAFDPTIRPLMRIWGFQMKKNRLPSESKVLETKKLCSFSKVVFNEKERSVFFSEKGMSIDLGGIAKGWAVDLALKEILEKTEIRCGLIDLGGNIRCLPHPPKGRSCYRIGVRDPKNKENFCHTVLLRNEGIATSGGYERFSVIGGKRFAHIIDPATGKPAETEVLSATVAAPTALEADALSTILFLRGEKFFRVLKKEKPSVRALLILRGKDGNQEFRKLGTGWISVTPSQPKE